MPILALGLSYRRAPVELLEDVSFSDEDFPKAYHRLTSLESVSEGVILSTCNRVEVYAEVGKYHQGFQDLKRFLAEDREVGVEQFAEPLYSHYEDHAAEHLFSVASGIDSMVLGESQILSQVRAARKRADLEGALGPALETLFQQAVRVGRRARAETGIGAEPAAFVEAGAVLATEHLGDLGGRPVLVVGAGTMGRLAAETLHGRGVGEITVVSRRPARAAAAAAKVGGRHGSLEDLPEALGRSDLVVSSTGATGVMVTRPMLEAVAGRTRFVLDLAVPRDVDPSAGDLPGIRVVDIDDLRDVVVATRGDARDEVAAVERIVGEESRRFATARRARRLAPLIEALQARGEEVRAAEVRRIASRLANLPERDREAVEAVTRRIVRSLLHGPVVRLKDLAGRGLEDAPARHLAELFDLDISED
ncbi:MAG: glutamyl-tRNA reductase [Actinomycetota bacterium]